MHDFLYSTVRQYHPLITDIEIKINSKKVFLKDYIEEVLPNADFDSANEKATEYLKEVNRI